MKIQFFFFSDPQYTGPSKPSITDSIGKLPPNATDMDPVMLLNQISPNSKFAEDTRDVRNGNIMFTFTVNFNGGKYSGTGKRFFCGVKN